MTQINDDNEVERCVLEAFKLYRQGRITKRELKRRVERAASATSQSKVIVLRMFPAEYERIKKEAAESKLSMNAWILSCCGF